MEKVVRYKANLDQLQCDICSKKKVGYDGITIGGARAQMCEECFKNFGTGLGLGKGQKLIKKEEQNGIYYSP